MPTITVSNIEEKFMEVFREVYQDRVEWPPAAGVVPPSRCYRGPIVGLPGEWKIHIRQTDQDTISVRIYRRL